MRTFTGVALLAGALLLVGAPRASVPANLTLDPGFEQDCSGVPCGWAPASSGATLSRDSVSPHSGSASLRLVLTSTAVEARSACIANASGGVYDVSFWYRTANSGFVASGRFNFYSTGDCSGSIAAQVLAQAGASADNAWHQLSASGEAAAGTHSFRVGLTFSCGACGGSPSMNFDDVSVVNTGLALDPGFEQDCSGVPCGWAAASSGATLSRDLVSPHSGSASLRLVLTSTAVEARSACIANASGGVYDASFWYRTASAGVGLASGRFNFYSTGDCSGSIAAQVLMQAGASADNAWHQLSASGEAAAGTHSFRVGLTFSCGACAGSPSMNFDDVSVVNTGLALDPGFEQDCSGVPCGWAAASSGASLSRDLVSPHSGSASLRLVLTSTAVEARSACIANVSGGVYDASFWYRTASAGVGLASGRFNFYSTGDCSGSIAAQVLMQAGASADNSWHQLSASGEAAAGTHSFRVGLTFSCGACAGSPSVNFDDVAFALPAPPTAAKLRSFQARPRKARAVSCSGRA